MHDPEAANVAVVPLTVQTLVVCEAKETVNPELAVATNVNGVPTVCVPGLLNVIVCVRSAATFTVNVCDIGVAAA